MPPPRPASLRRAGRSTRRCCVTVLPTRRKPRQHLAQSVTATSTAPATASIMPVSKRPPTAKTSNTWGLSRLPPPSAGCRSYAPSARTFSSMSQAAAPYRWLPARSLSSVGTGWLYRRRHRPSAALVQVELIPDAVRLLQVIQCQRGSLKRTVKVKLLAVRRSLQTHVVPSVPGLENVAVSGILGVKIGKQPSTFPAGMTFREYVRCTLRRYPQLQYVAD